MTDRPPAATLLGFDYGLRRIGVAVGQRLTATATALTTLTARDGQPDWAQIGALLAEWQPDALVVGRPCHADGTDSALSEATDRFARRLHGRFGLQVYRMDERLSSQRAEQHLLEERRRGGRRRDKADIDRIAAQIILQDWLDQNANNTHGE